MLTRTNEDINVTLEALNVQSQDHVLAVGGSGDMAFAFLSTGAKVVTADISQEQIKFINEQGERLMRYDYLGFMQARYASRSSWVDLQSTEGTVGNRFFNMDTISRTIMNMQNLEIRHGNVINHLNTTFNKVYLSNAIGFPQYPEEFLRELSRKASPITLFYASNGESILSYLKDFTICSRPNKGRADQWSPITFVNGRQ